MVMLIIHIIIAISSILLSTASWFKVSHRLLNININLVFLTLFTGVLLVFSNSANLAPACLSGILYLSIVSFNLYFAHKKLVTVKVKSIE